MEFIQRDFNRTKHDDFVLNVLPILEGETYLGAVEMFSPEGEMVGWSIKPIYE